MSRAWQPWQARWLETRDGRTRARQRGFPDRRAARAFAAALASGPAEVERIRVIANPRTPKGIT